MHSSYISFVPAESYVIISIDHLIIIRHSYGVNDVFFASSSLDSSSFVSVSVSFSAESSFSSFCLQEPFCSVAVGYNDKSIISNYGRNVIKYLICWFFFAVFVIFFFISWFLESNFGSSFTIQIRMVLVYYRLNLKCKNILINGNFLNNIRVSS